MKQKTDTVDIFNSSDNKNGKDVIRIILDIIKTKQILQNQQQSSE